MMLRYISRPLACFLFALMLVACSQEGTGKGGQMGARETEPTEPAERGKVISSELIGEKTLRQVSVEFQNNEIREEPRYGVKLYKIVYETIDVQGRRTVASGALAIPQGASAPLPLMSYQHGTVVNKHSVASSYGFDLSSIVFGGSGYVVASPDYLGLGESPGLHPYVHAASLATSIVDMLRAARTFCLSQNTALNGQLFLMGYSEGGYATMAAHRAMELNNADEFPVTASAPMAGPYDMSGAMRQLFMSDASYNNPFYMPYVILAFNEVYGLADSLGTLFREPYASQLPRLFDGTNEGFTINSQLPRVPKEMLNPEFLRSFETDSTNPLRRALADNDLWNWTPRAPMRLYHCTADDQVPYRNSEVAYEQFRKRGAAAVELVPLGHGGHAACGYPAIMEGKKWFDSLRR